MRVLAAGSVTNQMSLAVIWRGGKQSLIRDVRPNFIYEVDEGTGNGVMQYRSNGVLVQQHPSTPTVQHSNTPALQPLPASIFFEDVSHLLHHKHHEESFDDFVRQPLLPNKLSQLGPGVAWHDVDQDGWE